MKASLYRHTDKVFYGVFAPEMPFEKDFGYEEPDENTKGGWRSNVAEQTFKEAKDKFDLDFAQAIENRLKLVNPGELPFRFNKMKPRDICLWDGQWEMVDGGVKLFGLDAEFIPFWDIEGHMSPSVGRGNSTAIGIPPSGVYDWDDEKKLALEVMPNELLDPTWGEEKQDVVKVNQENKVYWKASVNETGDVRWLTIEDAIKLLQSKGYIVTNPASPPSKE